MRGRMSVLLATLLMMVLALAACNLGESVAGIVPTTGDTAADASAAQQFLPNVPGYNATDADSIVDALSTVAGGGSLLTGNLAAAGLVTQIDGMIQCYQNVGAAAARIYLPQNAVDVAGQLAAGSIPSVGVVAIINQDRLVNNFLSCALGGALQAFSAQAAQPQPCAASGTFTADGQTLHYLYAATTPDLCSAFDASLP
ncbi:MAG: hypothetical protein U0452_10930 [Anaerolineae bacterium]